jgi:hypothetical protein
MGSSVWNRVVSGSVVSGSEEWKASTVWSDYLFKKEFPYYRSGEVRYLRLLSSQQSIQDSFVPDLRGIYLTDSGSLVSSSLYGIGLFISTNGNSLTGSDGKNVSSNSWVFNSPFEKKYANVQLDLFEINRTLEVTTKYQLWGTAPGKSNIFFSSSLPTTTTIQKQDLFLATAFLPTSNSFEKYLTFDYNNLGYYNEVSGVWIYGPDYYGYRNDIKKSYSLFFGVNQKPLFQQNSFGVMPGSVNPSGNENYFGKGTAGITIEGWKYGLYNGLPTNFSAVFRQNHYGQFRDMLEQRIYTKTYNDPIAGGPMDANGGITFISGSALVGESDNWLTASIYNKIDLNVAEAYRVNPYGSGIFDIEYRASQPWHDEDTRTSPFGRRRV